MTLFCQNQKLPDDYTHWGCGFQILLIQLRSPHLAKKNDLLHDRIDK